MADKTMSESIERGLSMSVDDFVLQTEDDSLSMQDRVAVATPTCTGALYRTHSGDSVRDSCSKQ